ncbi:MAG: hypothetical protein PUG66_04825 [Clostridiales bacterium]|nr:hypothetical protein [Eubacterium sp.]MDD5993860.1 hypothetical protein [Clostridiales bacterium]MDD7349159.1 hypothetical protein [Clostridiales bacterium]MDY3773816.1 hypothetical protein [Eubacterium sp.]
MFRLWAKEFKSNRMIRDMVVENPSTELSRTKKIFAALDEICYEFDLSKPIWLEHNIEEFQRIDKTRFQKDNFIDAIDFDYLEIHVIEEDWE